MRKKFLVSSQDYSGGLSQALEYIHESLSALNLRTRDITRADLACEESLVNLLEHADFTKIQAFTVNVSKSFGNVNITLTVPGERFDFTGGFEGVLPLDDPEAAEALRNIVLRSFVQNLRYRHSGKHNIITVRAVRSAYSELYVLIGALVSAVIAGLLMRTFLTEDVYMLVNNSVFVPVRTIFINALKLCALPLVFLSIVLSMSDSGGLSVIRESGGKIFTYFLSTQIMATLLGFALVYVFRPGVGVGLTAASSVNAQTESFSVLAVLVNIIPSDLVSPFLNGDMLQLIALAVILGVSAGLSGANSITVIFNNLNEPQRNIHEGHGDIYASDSAGDVLLNNVNDYNYRNVYAVFGAGNYYSAACGRSSLSHYLHADDKIHRPNESPNGL